MSNDDDRPGTKNGLDRLESEISQLRGGLIEGMRKMQTQILREFQGRARTTDIRLRSLDERLALLEERVRMIEHEAIVRKMASIS